MPVGDKGKFPMDTGVWISIISLVLVVPLGMISTLLTPPLAAYLEQRKLVKSNRTKEQNVAEYRNIEAFKNRTRDRYPVYIAMSAISIICAIASAVCVLIATLGHIEGTPPFSSQPTIFLYLLAALFLCFSLLSLVIIAMTDRRIQNFDEYTAEVRKKWGDDVV
jgi:hypothetical protein